MKVAIVLALAALSFTLHACGELNADTLPPPADDVVIPPPPTMACVKIRMTPEILGARCENEEAVCYVTNGGMQCRFTD